MYALPGRERHGLPGGLSDEMSADDGTRALLKKVDSDIRKQYPGEIESIEPISYRTQIVAGMNFFIKVSALFRPLAHMDPQNGGQIRKLSLSYPKLMVGINHQC